MEREKERAEEELKARKKMDGGRRFRCRGRWREQKEPGRKRRQEEAEAEGEGEGEGEVKNGGGEGEERSTCVQQVSWESRGDTFPRFTNCVPS